MRYQRLLRFVQFVVPDGLFTRFVLKLLPPGDLWLILDRTNWKLGKSDVNVLLLSATWKSFSFPLMWTLLPHGGASAQRDRQQLLSRVLAVAGNRRVSGLLADREFVGKTWFSFLAQHQIAPCIRLRANSKMNGIPVWACFRKLHVGEVRFWHKAVTVYGVKLRVLATKNAAGEMLYQGCRDTSYPSSRGAGRPAPSCHVLGVQGLVRPEPTPLRAEMAVREPARRAQNQRLQPRRHWPHSG